MGLLDDIIARYRSLTPAQQAQVARDAMAATAHMCWIPQPGPQTTAYLCKADEIYYGGEAGGGKTDLVIGLSLTAHKRSLVLRRTNTESKKLVERFVEILGTRDGWNGQENVWRRPDGRIIDIGGCQHEDDKQRYKGNPHDLIAFDEVSDFSETMYTFIIGWNRSSDKAQRCRIVATGNPPTTAEGLWVIKRWGPWLDPHNPRPAKPGEIRWFTTGEDGKDMEVDGPGPHLVGGIEVMAKSRTFIRASLADNAYLGADYQARLAAMPEPYRSAYMKGRFDLSMKDQDRQVIPTQWVREAQARWTPDPPDGVPMCAIGVDPAQGGEDETTAAPRYDGWYAPLIVVPGAKTPMGSDIAAMLIARRKDRAIPVLDAGGGYASGIIELFKDNEIEYRVHKGAETATGRTHDGTLGFVNQRSQVYWKFREALDPDQPGGSPIMLPDDPMLVADLCAPTYEMTPRGIKVEPKEQLIKRLGRSPDRGDAVVLAWSAGAIAASHAVYWRRTASINGHAPRGNRPHLQLVANMGHSSARRRR